MFSTSRITMTLLMVATLQILTSGAARFGGGGGPRLPGNPANQGKQGPKFFAPPPVMINTLKNDSSIAEQVMAMEMKCKGVDVTMTEKQIMGMKECAKKVGVTGPNDMTPDKLPCFSKCILETKGLVDDKGKPHKENIAKAIDTIMSDTPVRTELKMHMEKCLDNHGAKVDPADASCMTYAPLATCTHQAFMDICKG